MKRFPDRHEAGQRLAAALAPYAAAEPVILALPCGGVPVGYEIARALAAPLDVWVARKVGLPWRPDIGVGAVAENSTVYRNSELVDFFSLPEREIDHLIHREEREVSRRVRALRAGHPRVDLRGRTVILVDDGIVTGVTMRAAIRSVRDHHAPRSIVLAAPIAPAETLRQLEDEVERVVCLESPAALHAIALWYRDFSSVSDEQVRRYLDRVRHRAPGVHLPAGAP